jgi:hypothetical protein
LLRFLWGGGNKEKFSRGRKREGLMRAARAMVSHAFHF